MCRPAARLLRFKSSTARIADFNTELLPTRRHLAPFEFSNFKNSLKSRGSRIVAKGDLTEKLERLKALLWTSREPIVAVVGWGMEVYYLDGAAIETNIVWSVHAAFYFSCTRPGSPVPARV